MSGLSRVLLVIVVLAVLGGGAFLATWDIPAPVSTVEKEIPNERFPR